MRLLYAGVAVLALAGTPAWAVTFKSLYSFAGGADGAGAYGRLVMDKAGVLYGVTVSGGASGRGTIFSLNPAGGGATILYSFSGGADGGNPQAGLSYDGKGNFYGLTPNGGLTAHCSNGCGTIFKFNPAKHILTTLYQFDGVADGAQPLAPVLLANGTLYGSGTYAGTGAGCPTQGCGTYFAFSLATQQLTVLDELVGSDGILAEGRMVPGPSGLLFGTTAEAGPHGSGTVFSLDPASGALGVVHGFDYHVDGSGSDADLLIRQGIAYGTERVGGPTQADDGTVYQMDLSSGAVTTLYSFTGQSDGLFPSFGVVLGAKGRLYGVTGQGGSSGAGTVYAVDPVTLKYSLLHDFAISDGSLPSGGLLVGKKGVLYGVTSGGGRGLGTVFEISP